MNPEHYDLLMQGVDMWSAWRREHPDIRPDLSYADLNGAHLSGVHLRHADLSHADLSRADLSGANLILANLSRADLSSAHLNSAHLSGTDLRYAKLECANFSHAHLSGDLSHANLSFAWLNNANISHANLCDAQLRFAQLSFANLNRVNLSGAYLWYANLSGANLIEANLSGANLSHANLSHANLREANLREADLSGASLRLTTFTGNDLSAVKGLVEIDHQGRSYISLDTVKLPQDGSALHFLRGAGVPDELISWYQSSMMHPIQYCSCFISYSKADEVLAYRLHADLQNAGVRCWFAPHDLKPGQLIREHIDQAIHMQDKLLLILSESSVKSGWVRMEVETALTREIRQQREILFPIRIDDAIFQSTANWAVCTST